MERDAWILIWNEQRDDGSWPQFPQSQVHFHKLDAYEQSRVHRGDMAAGRVTNMQIVGPVKVKVSEEQAAFVSPCEGVPYVDLADLAPVSVLPDRKHK